MFRHANYSQLKSYASNVMSIPRAGGSFERVDSADADVCVARLRRLRFQLEWILFTKYQYIRVTATQIFLLLVYKNISDRLTEFWYYENGKKLIFADIYIDFSTIL